MFRRITTILVVIACAAVAAAAGKVRTWTSADGRTMEAEFVRELDGDATFLKDGKLIVIRVEKLSEKDQQVIKELSSGKEPEPDPFSNSETAGSTPAEKPDGAEKPKKKPIAIQNRTWTDRFGVKSSGKFVRVDGNDVVLNRGTRVITVPFENLSDGDQEYVREILISQGKEADIPSGTSVGGEVGGGGAGAGNPGGVNPPGAGRGPGIPGLPPGIGPGGAGMPGGIGAGRQPGTPGGIGMPPGMRPPGVGAGGPPAMPPGMAGGVGPGFPAAAPPIAPGGAMGAGGMPQPGMNPSDNMPATPGMTIPGVAGMPPGMGTMPGTGAMPGMASMPAPGAMPGIGSMPGSGAMPGMGTMPGSGGMGSSGPGAAPGFSSMGPTSIPSGPSMQLEEFFECSKCGAKLTKQESSGTSCPRCNATWGFKQDQFGNKTMTTAGRGQVSTVAAVVVVVVLLGMIVFVALFIGIIVAIVKATNSSGNRPPHPQQMPQQRYY